MTADLSFDSRQCQYGHAEVARLLLEAKAEVNRASWFPYVLTPLHVAAGSGKLGCVRTLVAAGASTASATGEAAWVTPLFLAQRAKHADVVAFLEPITPPDVGAAEREAATAPVPAPTAAAAVST